MNSLVDWIPLGAAFLVLLGTYITVRATRGKTQVDYKSAMDKRVDEKMVEYTDRLEKRLEAAEKKAAEAEQKAQELSERVEHLEDSNEESNHREKLLYEYTSSLRDHILSGKTPPPPAIPRELISWYDLFATGETGLTR